ncbi:SDR family oxidoreductase [Kribbella sandramycini]|uniref:NAD(P)-dependent dehydrogenase (Short-subunit alcohol dehydrogenase family) n=1 Tax=Kribbella sandramycini TaxID=60450 RepID=A0A7Y4KW42_9ACTN|nr:SDR family oxidoreductase [Kribbella sandramycini]MBB6567749.1 NAD(P)-dependent dehydrogenase (short-subunit alcohol dehydrogenase family) [Kribbella sandramycini]NOL39655.1 SDR family oxidoreductase [Kribbella sandramycini]
MGRLTGKVAIITGASGLLGLAGVRAILDEGARVVAMGRSAKVEEQAKEFVAAGADVTPFRGDVSSEQDMAEVVDLAKRTYGRLDTLWNNAGLTDSGWMEHDGDVTTTSLEHLLHTFEVNAASVFLGAKYAIPVMAETGGGSIINTSSMQTAGGDMVMVSYGASKAAVEYLTLSVAASFGHLGIRSNAIAPGVIPPPGAEHVPIEAWPEWSRPQSLIRSSQSLDIAGEARDVAAAVVYLASDEARFLTGQVIRIDGGVTGHLPTLSERRKFIAS